MSNKDRYDRQFKALTDALARSIAEASDEEILEDADAAGVDLDANAAELKQMFLATSKAFQKRKFLEAQKAYEQQVSVFQQRSFQPPPTPEERRALLQFVIAQQAQLGAGAFTAKFRDFENLSDSDIASLLEELAALGLVPPKEE